MTLLSPQFVTFVSLVTVLTMIPGASTMLIVRSVLARGQSSGFVVIAGGCLGLYVHATLSALGLSAILVRSALAFEVVRLLGAVYLAYLGAHSIWRAWRHNATPSAHTDTPSAGWLDVGHHRQAFLEGLITILLSPETVVFYLAVLPQFVAPGDNLLLKSFTLATVHAVVRIVWYSLVAVFTGRLTALLRRPRVQRALEGISGVVLLGFGLRLILTRR